MNILTASVYCDYDHYQIFTFEGLNQLIPIYADGYYFDINMKIVLI